ncbi:PREDICTED: protein Daple-like [Ipomoea nil]|uniref:protein Daple-like n=1 Tax=Ipomoea nil TaxID=35883 RepID=UPI000900B4D3|nr:PREDICTED: protein Daple-like [Ipomoea nil]XP_019185910.1 PREDICTED: protein Daple-like [Ipomoea nil]XP_019185911.1 PREDICTED: protein Daple-like [Ipomoea nil]
MVMQSIGLHQRLQEASREYTELEKTQRGLEHTLREEEDARRRIMRELKTLKEAHQTLQQEYRALGDKQQALQEDHRILGEEHQALQEEHKTFGKEHQVLQEKHKTLGEEHQALQGEHKTLLEEHKKQQQDHDKALEGAVEDWQRTEDFARAPSEYSCTHMPGLIRWWLGHSDRSSEGMVEAMLGWQSVQEYQDYTGPPLVHVLQEWATTLGGRVAMGPVAEVWLRETLEG